MQTDFLFEFPLEGIPASQLPETPSPSPACPKQATAKVELTSATTEPVSVPCTAEKAGISAPPVPGSDLLQQVLDILPQLPDDITMNDPLILLGYDPAHIKAADHSLVIRALLGPPVCTFQWYESEPGKIRFRRLLPVSKCPGTADSSCETMTRGGVPCKVHSSVETPQKSDLSF